MKIQFLGVGTQFSSYDQYHSNMVITAQSGKRMMIDCGSDARFSLAESGFGPEHLDAVYVSHLHADHIGGLEWLALSTYFGRDRKPLKLFCEGKLQERLWNNSLKGGLECIGDGCLQLADYFDCHPLAEDGGFVWEGLTFKLVKMPHVAGARSKCCSYGLLVDVTGDRSSLFFISTDTIYQPRLLESLADNVVVIFHDCETSSHTTTVHAHYNQLCQLPVPVKQKIWLYHYEPNSVVDAQADGFLGFVAKGQEFAFPQSSAAYKT